MAAAVFNSFRSVITDVIDLQPGSPAVVVLYLAWVNQGITALVLIILDGNIEIAAQSGACGSGQIQVL